MRRQNAFTLIEVMVVLVVLTVLITAGTVSYTLQKQRSEYKGMRASAHVLAGAMKNYFYTTNAYVTTANTAQTNSRYGTQISDSRFCRYLVFMSGANPRIRVTHGTTGCGTGVVSTYTFDIHGAQIFCAGGSCMTG